MKKFILIFLVTLCIEVSWSSPYSKNSYHPVKAFVNILTENELIGEVIFEQNSPGDLLEISVNFMFQSNRRKKREGYENPIRKFILQIHEHRVYDPRFAFAASLFENSIDTSSCLYFGGNAFNRFFDPMLQFGGDFGIIETDSTGTNVIFKSKSENFTLYGSNSILGRSLILFEIDEEMEFQMSYFPPQVNKIINCDTIGLFPRPFGESLPVSHLPLTPLNLNYESDKYGSYDEPRAAMSFLRDLTITTGGDVFVLFEQENSYAPLRVSGLGRTSFSTVGDVLRLTIHEFKTEYVNGLPPDLNSIFTGREFYPLGLLNVIDNCAEDPSILEPAVAFIFNDTIATLYGENSIVGRTLQLHGGKSASSDLKLFDTIGLINPEQFTNNAIKRVLKAPDAISRFDLDEIQAFFNSEINFAEAD